jgi:hypothetical protein
MRSGLIRLPRGPRWLRGHVEVVPVPGHRTHSVTARTPAPEVSISLRRHPAAGRVTIEEVRR